MEHPHRCVYCERRWFCDEGCPIAGPSACEHCRETVRRSPKMTRRVVPLGDVWVLDRLAQQTAEQLRASLRRRQQ